MLPSVPAGVPEQEKADLREPSRMWGPQSECGFCLEKASRRQPWRGVGLGAGLGGARGCGGWRVLRTCLTRECSRAGDKACSAGWRFVLLSPVY